MEEKFIVVCEWGQWRVYRVTQYGRDHYADASTLEQAIYNAQMRLGQPMGFQLLPVIL